MGASIEALDPDLAQGLRELLQLCANNGLRAQLTSTVRTFREQKFLYERYTSGNSPLPAVPPGHSAHEYGWAFDMVVTPGEAQSVVGGWWETYWGGTYGGKRDPVHFELPGSGAYAFQLGEQSNSGNASEATMADTAYDFILGLAPGYSAVQLAAALAMLIPGLKQSTVLDWLANPHKYPKQLVWLQQAVGLL
jgi:hypothetical protein